MTEVTTAELETAIAAFARIAKSDGGRRILRRWLEAMPSVSDPDIPAIGVPAALRAISDACEILADHTAYLAEVAEVMTPLRQPGR